LIYLHSWSLQPHHPDISGAGGEKLLDLDLQLGFVLAGVGVLDGEGRCTLDPARLVGHLTDGQIRSPEDFRRRGKADVHTDIANRRIAREQSVPNARRLASPAPGGRAVKRIAVGQLVRVAGPQLVRTGRGPGWRTAAASRSRVKTTIHRLAGSRT
jgi:hypothetical protein